MTFKSLTITTFTTFCAATVLVACKSSQIPLSDAEIEFSKKLTQDYQCTADLQHDYEAINNKRKDGIFWIQLKSTNKELCSKDSAFLKKIATDVATMAKGIISYKQNYHYISLNFNTSISTGENSSRTTCYKKLEIDMMDLNNVRIVDWMNED